MSKLEHAAYNVLKVMLVVVLIMLIAIVGRTKAQDVPQVSTGFTVSCQSGDPSRIYFLVESDGVEDYSVSVFPESVPMSIPTTFTTHVGKYLLGWLDGSNLNLEVHFTNSQGFDAVMPIQPDYFAWCDHDDEQPIPEPSTDVPDVVVDAPVCEHSAVDYGTGRAYCYTDADLGPIGQIPIPPAP